MEAEAAGKLIGGNPVLKRAALDAILPFDRRDQLASLLTDDDVATLPCQKRCSNRCTSR